MLAPWRDLLRVFRRLEARGDVRGGRFVSGPSGEQYALPEAVGLLRSVRREAQPGELIAISAADPLNLVGILTPGDTVPALAGNRILFRDGVPVAVRRGEEREVTLLVQASPPEANELKTALVRRRSAPLVRAYLARR
jgi:ATP-dependent Lhr-like helicase